MNLLVIGNSDKFIRFVKIIYPDIDRILIIPWRSASDNFKKKEINEERWDIVLIAGYNYKSCNMNYQDYINCNVHNIVYLLENIFIDKRKIIYINTANSKKMVTYSRYLYAKMMLGEIIQEKFENVDVISLPTVIESGKISVYGYLYQYIAKILYLFRIINVVDINKNRLSNIYIYKLYKKSAKKPKPICIKYARPLVFDRAIRLIYG